MEDEIFTIKEMEIIKILHDFRKSVGYGKLTISFHDHDVVEYELQSNLRLRGGTTDMGFAQQVFILFDPITKKHVEEE